MSALHQLFLGCDARDKFELIQQLTTESFKAKQSFFLFLGPNNLSCREFRSRHKDRLKSWHDFKCLSIQEFFWQTLQRAWPDLQLIADNPLYHSFFWGQVQQTWVSHYGRYLDEVLNISHFNRSPARISKNMLQAAKLLGDTDRGHILLPEADNLDYAACRQNLLDYCFKVQRILQPEQNFYLLFSRLYIHAATKKKILEKIISPLISFFAEFNILLPDFQSLEALLLKIKNIQCGNQIGINCLVPDKWLKNKGNNLHICPQAFDLRESLQELFQGIRTLRSVLLVHSIAALQYEVSTYKNKNLLAAGPDLSTKFLQIKEFWPKLAPLVIVDQVHLLDIPTWQALRETLLTCGCQFLLFAQPYHEYSLLAGQGRSAMTRLWEDFKVWQKQKLAEIRYLPTDNFESTPPVAALNKILYSPHWLQAENIQDFAAYKFLQHLDVAAGQAIGLSDDLRQTLSIIDLSSQQSPLPAYKQLAEFIAGEIEFLLKNKVLSSEEIIIFYALEKDALYLEKTLKDRELEFEPYQPAGLFYGQHTKAVLDLLLAIYEPGNISAFQNCLLGPFWGISRKHLSKHLDLPESHPIFKAFTDWRQLADQKKWAEFFAALQSESTFWPLLKDKAGWEHEFNKYQRLFASLESLALAKSWTLSEVYAWLQKIHLQALLAGEHQILDLPELYTSKIKLRPLGWRQHFKAVFLFGALTRSPWDDDFHFFHFDSKDQSGHIVDMLAGHQEENRREQDYIYKTLLTQAMSCADKFLYLPYFKHTGPQSWGGVVATDLSLALQDCFGAEQETSGVAWLAGDMYHKPQPLLPKKIIPIQADLPDNPQVAACIKNILSELNYSIGLDMLRRKIPWSDFFLHPKCKDLFSENLQQYALLDKSRQVSKVIGDCLSKHLPVVEVKFYLARLPKKNYMGPINFEHNNSIDMVFEWGQLFYLVQWQGTFLHSGYDWLEMEKQKEKMLPQAQQMGANFIKWLGRSEDEPLQRFGGVFFLFWRGISGPVDDGVCFFSPQDL